MIRISRVLCRNLALFGLFFLEVFWCFCARSMLAGAVNVCLWEKYGALLVFLCLWPLEGLLIWLHNTLWAAKQLVHSRNLNWIVHVVFVSKYICVDGACVIILDLKATQLCAVCMYMSRCSEWWVWQLTKRASWEVRLSSGLVCRRCGVCVHLFTRKCVIGCEYVSENRIYDSSGIVCFVFKDLSMTFNTFSMFLVAMWIFIPLKYWKVGQKIVL